MKISAAERERRSRAAKQNAKFGGAQAARKSHAARARRSSELAQRLVQDLQTPMEAALRDALKNGNRSQKLKATELLLRMGLSAERLDFVDERQHLDRAVLIERITEALTVGPVGHLVRAHLEQGDAAIDGQAVERHEPPS